MVTTVPTIFGTFEFPIAMVIVLLLAIGTLFYLLWKAAERREEQLQIQIKEAQARTDAINDKFIAALKDQNLVSKLIAEALAPVKSSTDLIPPMASDQRQTLSDINHIIGLVRDLDQRPNRRSGDQPK